MNAFILIALKLLAVLALVLLNAFFVAAELALVRIRDTQLSGPAQRGNRRARTARHIISHLDAYISATQFGITLVSLGLGVAVEPVFESLLTPLFDLLNIPSPATRGHIALGVGFFVNCYLLIVAGELVPKAVAIRKTLSTALWVASPLHWFYKISYPFIWLLQASSQAIVRQLGVDPETLSASQSEEELRMVLKTAQGPRDARDLILNALDLRNRTVREVMRPRSEIVTLDISASMADCLELVERTRYSRYPLCEEGDPDRTLGVVHIKDIYACRNLSGSAGQLLPHARKLPCVPESVRLDKLLRHFLDRKLHFCLVVDEYGGTLGVATLENVMEALVGQIQDEFDSEVPELRHLQDQSWEASGGLPLHELEKIIGQVAHEEGVATVSGWVTQHQGGFAKPGQAFVVNGFELRVDEMDGPKVARLRITKCASGETEFTNAPRESQSQP